MDIRDAMPAYFVIGTNSTDMAKTRVYIPPPPIPWNARSIILEEGSDAVPIDCTVVDLQLVQRLRCSASSGKCNEDGNGEHDQGLSAKDITQSS